jgi:RecJ-like exonuclease
MADIGISRHNIDAAYDMADGKCPACEGLTGIFPVLGDCNRCGGKGRLLPYRVDEGVRCVTCNEFIREPDGSRYCDLIYSPLWSSWIYHACPLYAVNDERPA